jgi:hypothetical protein
LVASKYFTVILSKPLGLGIINFILDGGGLFGGAGAGGFGVFKADNFLCFLLRPASS